MLAILAALTAAFYQFYLKDLLYNRLITPIGNEKCQKIPTLRACESEHVSLVGS